MKKIITMTPLLQCDYGKDLDCALTSMTVIINYMLKEKKEVQEIYDIVEKNAEKRFYNGNKWGTMFLMIRSIFNVSLHNCGIKKWSKCRYLKGLMYRFGTVKKAINAGSPVILNMLNDGKDYYKDHSITIIGYNDDGKIFYVYDNWSKDIREVEYKKLSFISSINWV